MSLAKAQLDHHQISHFDASSRLDGTGQWRRRSSSHRTAIQHCKNRWSVPHPQHCSGTARRQTYVAFAVGPSAEPINDWTDLFLLHCLKSSVCVVTRWLGRAANGSGGNRIRCPGRSKNKKKKKNYSRSEHTKQSVRCRRSCTAQVEY